jgi:bacteriorhodopsin
MSEVLSPTDVVGGSFWLLSTTMIAASFFFLLERKNVAAKWHTSVTLAGVVTMIGAVQYFYMRDMWITTGTAPIIMRYLDWMLSFPLQVVLFFVILSVVTQVSAALFWRLLVGALVMVIAKFLGAAGYMSVTLGFLIGMVGWLYVLGELYMGEADKANLRAENENFNSAFNSLRLIVTIGWAVYPLGYFIEHLGGGIEINSLNIIYNLIDFLNKLVFGLVIYRLAQKETKSGGEHVSVV